MQRLKLLVLAAMAALSLGALVASSASAVTPAGFLPATGFTFTGTSGPGTLTALGGVAKIECESDKSEGSVAANSLLGPVTIDFEKCKNGLTGSKCTGLGEAAGVILVSGEAHLVVDTETPALGAGFLFLVNLVHFECGVVLSEVKGEVLCLIKPVATLTKHFEIVCKESSLGSGDPEETTYWNEAGTEVKIPLTAGLLTSISHGTFKSSGENTTALILTSKEVTIDA